MLHLLELAEAPGLLGNGCAFHLPKVDALYDSSAGECALDLTIDLMIIQRFNLFIC